MASTYWIKLYHEILEDPKVARLPDTVWRKMIELFLLAGDEGKGGYLPEPGEIAWRLRCDQAELESILTQLENVGILTNTDDGWLVTKFADRQDAETNVERQRRYREEKQRRTYYSNAPRNESLHNSVTNPNVDIDIDIDIDKDKDTELTAAKNAAGKLPLPPPLTLSSKKSIKPAKSTANPLTSHPAIQLVKGLTRRYPNQVNYDEVIATFGEHPDGPKAAECYRVWCARGCNSVGLGWLDWYRDGVPENARSQNKTNGRGPPGRREPAGRTPDTPEDRRRYIEGEYANFVEH